MSNAQEIARVEGAPRVGKNRCDRCNKITTIRVIRRVDDPFVRYEDYCKRCGRKALRKDGQDGV